MRLSPLLFTMIGLSAIAPLTAHAVTVQQIVDQISATSYQSYLENTFNTRNGANRAFQYGANVNSVVQHGADHDAAADAIYTGFRRSGWTTRFDSFCYTDTSSNIWSGRNVVAVKQGTTRPDEIYLISAHYDSTANHEAVWSTCPGADDNGSGCAALLEMARVLSAYTFDCTIVLAAFDGEEVGINDNAIRRLGSTHYVSEHSSDHILGMVSADAIAWSTPYAGDPTTGEDLRNKVDIEARTNMEPIVATLQAAVQTYGGGLGCDVRANPGNYSDYTAFADAGFQAVEFIEDGWWSNLNYHRQSDSVDTPDYLNYTYATNMVRSLTGWVATQASVNGGSGTAGLLEMARVMAPYTFLKRRTK